MKITCHVIRDILPLYAEDIASDDTRTVVEEHLRSCKDCKKALEEMRLPEKLPIDSDTAPLKKLKATLRRKKIMTILFSVMMTAVFAVVLFAYLTAPEYLPYSENTLSITESGDGKILVVFGEDVSGYEINYHPSEDNSGYVYHMTAWDSLWSKFFGKGRIKNTVLNPDGERVAAVYYYSAGLRNDPYGNEDILIYGTSQVSNGGVLTLPRLALAYYLKLAVILAMVCGAVLLLYRRNEKARNILIKIVLLPVSYIFGHLLIMGFSSATYLMERDFFTILLTALPIYIALLAAEHLIKDYLGRKNV